MGGLFQGIKTGCFDFKTKRGVWSTYCVSSALPRSAARFLPACGIHFTGRRPYAAPRRTRAISQPSIARVSAPTTSTIVHPDGTLFSYHPYGEKRLLIADIDITAATGTLAARYSTVSWWRCAHRSTTPTQITRRFARTRLTVLGQ